MAAGGGRTAAENRQLILDLGKSQNGYRSAFTRAINVSVRARDYARHSLDRVSGVNITDITSYIAKVKGAFHKVEQCFEQMRDLDDPAAFDEYVTKIEEDETRMRDELEAIMDTLAAIDAHLHPPLAQAAAPAPAAAAGAGGGPRLRVNLALKPFELSKEHSPMELRDWIEQFRAYFSSSHMELSTVPEQHAYLKSCLDSYLTGRLRDAVQPNTAMFGDAGCIALVEEIFRHKYPLFTRRLAYFRTEQVQGQAFTDWSSALRDHGDGADLPNLDVDQMYVMRYLVGIKDEKLRELFLREANPTQTRLDEIATQYETSCANLKAMSSASASAAAAFSGPGRGRGNSRGGRGRGDRGGRGGGRPSNTNCTRQDRIQQISDAKLCFKCGYPDAANHASVCRGRDGICKICERPGHFSPVCLQGYSGPGRIPNDSRANQIESSTRCSSRDHSPDSVVGALTNMVITRVIKGSKAVNKPTPRMMVQLRSEAGSFDLNALPDSGATRTLLSSDIARKFGIRPIPSRRDNITVANGDSIPCEGAADLAIFFEGRGVIIDALITPGLQNELLLSWYDLVALGVLPANFPCPRALAINSSAASATYSANLPRQSYAQVLTKNLKSPRH